MFSRRQAHGCRLRGSAGLGLRHGWWLYRGDRGRSGRWRLGCDRRRHGRGLFGGDRGRHGRGTVNRYRSWYGWWSLHQYSPVLRRGSGFDMRNAKHTLCIANEK